MAGKFATAGFGKDDRPGHIGHLAPELAVDEVGQTAEKQSGRDRGRNRIRHLKEREFAPAGKTPDCEADAHKTASAGPAPLPPHKKSPGWGGELPRVTKEENPRADP